jgi:hypothetical protein
VCMHWHGGGARVRSGGAILDHGRAMHACALATHSIFTAACATSADDEALGTTPACVATGASELCAHPAQQNSDV